MKQSQALGFAILFTCLMVLCVEFAIIGLWLSSVGMAVAAAGVMVMYVWEYRS